MWERVRRVLQVAEMALRHANPVDAQQLAETMVLRGEAALGRATFPGSKTGFRQRTGSAIGLIHVR